MRKTVRPLRSSLPNGAYRQLVCSHSTNIAGPASGPGLASPGLNSVTLAIGQAKATQRCGGQAPREARTQGRLLRFSQQALEHQRCAQGDEKRRGIRRGPEQPLRELPAPHAARAQPRGVGRDPEAPRGPGADFSGQGKGRTHGHPRSKAWGGGLLLFCGVRSSRIIR